ncbi:class I tRNA ligase family protein [Xenorhabdus bovienii]|uniref:class I tRNA ligase family protein n=1 Tax=Xenorhabdus bovienii TaxID=40576 RepID=UPI001EDDFF47|nr:class I tRNA ligase family protein [Xenorhabdus bovienii]MCG3462484.1 class I tRNA ligase family protein [Xenorhabdus bovienii]
MQTLQFELATFSPAFGIDMSQPVVSGGYSQISAAWGTVPVGGQTTPHKHDEVEAFVILSGQGKVITDGQYLPVSAGTLIVFEPFESHVLCNTGDQPLKFTDFYWRDAAQRQLTAQNNADSRLQERPIFIFSTPPTPNGDLHLGHLSGPYLGADVMTRFLRATGKEAYHLTGSDDYQSYVIGCARQENSTPKEVASRYAAEIKATLDMMDIHLDQFTITSDDPNYASGLRDFFSRLVAGGLSQKNGPALFDSVSGDYLYEVDVHGYCPTCNSSSNGNICEECGEPNTCVEFIAPHSRLSEEAPRRGEATRYSLCLSDFKSTILAHQQRAKISPRLQQLTENVLARPDFNIPITHPAEWGISPREETVGSQVIWVWPEMAYGFLHGIAEIGKRLGRDWQANKPQADWKIMHFFGYDNSFYHAILYPVLYNVAFPEWQCDIDYNDNEFYLLDGLKFSTSRRHAIWGKDILTPETVDSVRFYLAWTRGEQTRTNFTLADFHRCVDDVLVGQWQHWLSDLGLRVEEDFSSLAPDAGTWTPAHIAYFTGLENRLRTLRNFYSADGFSLNCVVDELNTLVRDAIKLAATNQRIRSNSAVRNEYRTSVALELATAQLLASVTAPILPRFSASLFNALGGVSIEQWPERVSLVTSGLPIELTNCVFFKSVIASYAEETDNV